MQDACSVPLYTGKTVVAPGDSGPAWGAAELAMAQVFPALAEVACTDHDHETLANGTNMAFGSIG
jgi:hypothetical protein